MSGLDAWLEGVALVGPGLPDWSAAEAVLAGRAPYRPQATVIPAATALPAAERRRTGRTVRLALALGFEAAGRAGFDPGHLVTVFASSGGDGENCHAICSALASPDRQLSPTRFHNSVHNAPAGYWSIATGARAASTALCAFDASFAAGMLEAVTQIAVGGEPVLLIAYDDRYPAPLAAKRPVEDAFGIALALAPARGSRSLARLRLELDAASAEPLAEPELERLRRGIPAARGLPLLQALARRESRQVRLEYLGSSSLQVAVEPC